MIVVLGEVGNRQHMSPQPPHPRHAVRLLQIGGTEEYKICEAIQRGRITKPVVCWCIGTCATMFSSEVRGRDRRFHSREISRIMGTFPS